MATNRRRDLIYETGLLGNALPDALFRVKISVEFIMDWEPVRRIVGDLLCCQGEKARHLKDHRLPTVLSAADGYFTS
jgi:hypothetical protein